MRVPSSGELNPWLLAGIEAFPTQTGYLFDPPPLGPDRTLNPRDPAHDGVTANILYGGECIARSASGGQTYCCGVTFELFVDAWRAWSVGDVAGLNASAMQDVLSHWFCPTMGHSGVVHALVSRGLGTAVETDDAQPGDLCQFWRRLQPTPSGHSVVFLAWRLDGNRRFLRYWSSQTSTNGPGKKEEEVGADWAVHLVRVGIHNDEHQGLESTGRYRSGTR
jgi:hypothetical protein